MWCWYSWCIGIVYSETTIGTSLRDYRKIDGLLIARQETYVATLFRFGESSSETIKNRKTRVEEVWKIEDINVPQISLDYFIPPYDICDAASMAEKKEKENKKKKTQKTILLLLYFFSVIFFGKHILKTVFHQTLTNMFSTIFLFSVLSKIKNCFQISCQIYSKSLMISIPTILISIFSSNFNKTTHPFNYN